MSDVTSRFKKVDVSSFPDIHLLDDDLDVVLWVLVVGHEKLNIPSMSAAEVADVATTVFRRPLSRQRAASLLADEKKYVAREARSSPARFVVMQAGIDLIRGKKTAVVIVDPEASFSALRQLDQLLGSVEGEVLLCDPYVDDKTLLALAGVPKASSIKLLSLNISDPPQFRRKLQAYEKEFGNLELRTSTTPDLHDRYLIDQKRMWIFGQSLNGIGKKQTFIVAAGQDVRATMLPVFNRKWSTSQVWK